MQDASGTVLWGDQTNHEILEIRDPPKAMDSAEVSFKLNLEEWKQDT